MNKPASPATEKTLKEKNKCPECGGNMIPFSSLFKKVCSVCGYKKEWPLDEGQQHLIRHQR